MGVWIVLSMDIVVCLFTLIHDWLCSSWYKYDGYAVVDINKIGYAVVDINKIGYAVVDINMMNINRRLNIEVDWLVDLCYTILDCSQTIDINYPIKIIWSYHPTYSQIYL